jgi:hypothetical protein
MTGPPAPSGSGTAPVPAATSSQLTAALQQLAAILPALLQAAAPSGAGATKSTESFDPAEIGVDLEALEPGEWELASLGGGWTVP